MARVFEPGTHALLRAVLNRLIPAGNQFPGAGDVELLPRLDEAAGASPMAIRMYVDGVQQITLESERRYQRRFEELAGAEQDSVLRAIDQERPVFFESLLRQVYVLYYSQPIVMPLLGLEAGSPQPAGHALPPFDPALTRAMGQRPPFYRRPPQ